MKLAVISDIHGNLTALEAVLTSISREGVDKTVCLGDVVGYGARPNECVALMQENAVPCLLGNHDEAAIDRGNINNFNRYAAEAIHWTSGQLNSDSRKFLIELDFTMEIEGLLLVHASPDEPQAWHYILSAFDGEISFRAFDHPVCFFGHTHYPVIFTTPDGTRRLINAGSVGQPRDHDPRACWGLHDTETGDFRWVRVEYRAEQTAKEIISAGLPRFLADRLLMGV